MEAIARVAAQAYEEAMRLLGIADVMSGGLLHRKAKG